MARHLLVEETPLFSATCFLAPCRLGLLPTAVALALQVVIQASVEQLSTTMLVFSSSPP